jgi:hypothetical protein
MHKSIKFICSPHVERASIYVRSYSFTFLFLFHVEVLHLKRIIIWLSLYYKLQRYY